MNLPLLNLLKKLKDRCPLFNNFSDHELGIFLTLSKIQKYEFENQSIFFQGEKGNCVYLILEGEVVIFYLSKVRGEKVINTLQGGDIFGEMSLITGDKRSANAKVKKAPVLTLVISDKIIEPNSRVQAKIYKNFARIIADRLKDKNKEASQLTG